MSRANEPPDASAAADDALPADADFSYAGESDYARTLELLYRRIDYEKIGHAPYTANHYRLDRMRQLLDLLGKPQNTYAIVHIAGTKGKGTTATLIDGALRACGLRCGLVTSPHLLRLEERIQFQGQPCTEQQLIELADEALGAAAKLEELGGGRATFFELTTAMGLLHAARQGAQCVVLEVGLGGRLDSTNICEPVVTIITSISLDHQAQLGNTIAEIAAEKAGIIKPGVPVVCTARNPEARRVVQRIADEQQAPLALIDRDFTIAWQARPAADQTPLDPWGELTYRRTGTPATQATTVELTTRLLGEHQSENVAGALAAIELLRELGWHLPPEQANAALANCTPRARLEVVGYSPLRVVDTAHNPASIDAALRALDDHCPGRARVIVFASSRDKDYLQMLRLLIPKCDHLILTAYRENPRALPSDALAEAAAQLAIEYAQQSQPADKSSAPNLHRAVTPLEAWTLATSLAHADGLILATGSFFLAAELLPIIYAH